MADVVGTAPSNSPTEVAGPPALARRARRGRVPHVPRTVILSVIWVGVLIVLALLGPAITPHDPLADNLRTRNIPPVWLDGGSWDHVLGTDQLGYDLLSRVMVSVRPTLIIGLLASLIALVIAIAAVAAFGQSITILIILAGFSGWMGFARTVRANVLTLRTREFVVSSRALGAGDVRILYNHILPNIASTVIVLITIQFRSLILFESALSFLGLGVPPPQPSWGSMINGGRDYLLSAWWINVVPGIALMLTVLTVSLVGDWLRDVLDPTLRNLR